MENNIFKLLMHDDSVNDYTKLYLILYQLNYYKRYYIPNKMISNRLKLSIRNSRRLLKQFEDKGIIKITYIDKKRYFRFTWDLVPKIDIPEKFPIIETIDYDWLNEDEGDE